METGKAKSVSLGYSYDPGYDLSRALEPSFKVIEIRPTGIYRKVRTSEDVNKNISLKAAKLRLNVKVVEYVGRQISKEGISMSSKNNKLQLLLLRYTLCL